LTELSGSPFTGRPHNIGITIDPTGQYVFLSDNYTGEVASMVIGAGGALTNAANSPYATGTGGSFQSAVTPNGKYVYFTSNANGMVAAFAIGSGGVLTSIPGSPFTAGINLSGIVINPAGNFLYATDATDGTGGGRLYGFQIQPDGTLVAMNGSPWTSAYPIESVTLDPTGIFLYATTCYGYSFLRVYTVDPTTGELTEITSSPYGLSNPNLQAVVDPTGQFLYSSDWQYGNNIHVYAINRTTGALTMPGASFTSANPLGMGIANLTAYPVASLSPATISFTQATGSTSAAQAATLSNTGTAALSISGISITGTNPNNFAIATGANACGTTLAVNSTCKIYVTFTPATTVSYSATLSVADNAAGSPHTLSLSGTGVNFAIAASPAAQIVIPGHAVNYTVTVTAQNGTFSNAVTFAASGLPTNAITTFSPASVTPGSSSASSTLTVQIPWATTSMNRESGSDGLVRRLAPFSLALLLLPFVGCLRRAGRRFGRMLPVLLLLIAGMAAMAGMSGCNSTIGFFGQAQQSYTVGVTGTSGTLSHTSNVTLTVE